MSVPGQRGRKVVRNNRSSLTTFYMVIGGALILILGFGIVYALRSRTSSDARAALTAQIGRTAEGYYYKGSPDAPIKVVEYADYQCPGCGEFDRTLAPLIDRDYVATGKVQFIYHELPLTSIHPNAQAAAEAARCAGDQD
ncbi:MAG: thioredoxin domain-containing protein, partial [Oscillochloris sp.]|nr:thioredoxin domain-containing protein [Oscillochloris sp.]